jgi:release factor glutamine methyltransferase
MTVQDALAWAGRVLAEAQVSSPDLDAELLLRHVLGWDRARILVDARQEVSAEGLDRFRTLVYVRATRRPLQHLTGVQAFWRHNFVVTAATLIPRPETELLVETALELMRGITRPVIVDVGTGTGCIAISLAAERPDADVHAVDVSAAALDVARENSRRLAIPVQFHEGDLLAPLGSLAGRVDLVVSNPPYVEPEEIAALEPEVRDHDPRGALVPPEGVAAMFGRLAREAGDVLRSGGHLVVEMGAAQEAMVTAALKAAGLRDVAVRQDLAGLPRVVLGRR